LSQSKYFKYVVYGNDKTSVYGRPQANNVVFPDDLVVLSILPSDFKFI